MMKFRLHQLAGPHMVSNHCVAFNEKCTYKAMGKLAKFGTEITLSTSDSVCASQATDEAPWPCAELRVLAA